MKKYLFYPLYIFLFVFLVDKLFYIPGVRELFVKNNYNFYDMIFSFEDSFYDYHLEKWKKKGLSEQEIFKNTMVFIGTSRSETFREYTEKDIINNPFIQDQNKILNKPVIAHFMRAGTVFHIYQLFEHVTEKYPKDVVFALEVNYGGLNENSYIRQRKDAENLKWSSFKEIYPMLSTGQILSFVTSRLFVLNLYSVSLTKPFQKNKAQSPEELIKGLFVLVKQYVATNTDNSSGFILEGNHEGQESSEVKEKYKLFIEEFMNTLFYKFKVSSTDNLLLKKIIQSAKKKNLKIIFYRPKIHKDLRKETDLKFKEAEENYLQELTTFLNQNGYSFYDLEKEGEIKCAYYRDPSHLSKTCIPEIIEKFDKVYSNEK